MKRSRGGTSQVRLGTEMKTERRGLGPNCGRNFSCSDGLP